MTCAEKLGGAAVPHSVGELGPHLTHCRLRPTSVQSGFLIYQAKIVSWSLTSLFSTNMAISERKGQGWKVIRTQ